SRADIGEIQGGELSDDEIALLLGALRSPDAITEADAVYDRLVNSLADDMSPELAKREVIGTYQTSLTAQTWAAPTGRYARPAHRNMTAWADGRKIPADRLGAGQSA